MKKLLAGCLLCIFVMVSYSATITYKWNAVDNPVKANGLPPKYLKLYYGSALRTYTNSITVSLTNINTTNIYTGYDQYNCNPSSVRNYVEAKVTGLVLGQQIFSAYSVINSNGFESPLINEATCGFTVTNNSDAIILPPRNFRIASVN